MPSYFWMTNESGIYLEAFGKRMRDLTQPERLVLQEPNRNEHLPHLVILLKVWNLIETPRTTTSGLKAFISLLIDP